MHPVALREIVESVRRRVTQGDCPTEPKQAYETLEEIIVELDAKIRGNAPAGTFDEFAANLTPEIREKCVQFLATYRALRTVQELSQPTKPSSTAVDESLSELAFLDNWWAMLPIEQKRQVGPKYLSPASSAALVRVWQEHVHVGGHSDGPEFGDGPQSEGFAPGFEQRSGDTGPSPASSAAMGERGNTNERD